MKRVTLYIISLLSAFVIVEGILRLIIGYPTYGVEKKVKGIRSSQSGIENIYFPYSRYWNTEGGNQVYSRNNLGLPGVPVDTTASRKYIFVLGSSFIEAYQIPPDKMATSVLKNGLKSAGLAGEVLNLGHSGHDPFDSYFYSKYFAQRFKPHWVVLILNSSSEAWFNRHPHPLQFNLPMEFGQQIDKVTSNIIISLRNTSSFIELLVKYALQLNNNRNEDVERPIDLAMSDNVSKENVSEDLLSCIEHFKITYGNKFSLVSIVNSTQFNNALKKYCDSSGITFEFKELLQQEYMIKGAGHLNEEGNRLLGEYLFQVYQRYESR